MKFDPQIIIFLAFAFMALYAVYMFIKTRKKGSLLGALLNAKVEKTIGEIPVRNRMLINTSIRVHALRGEANERLVGIELVSEGAVGYDMTPISLSVEKTEQLVTLLQGATKW